MNDERLPAAPARACCYWFTGLPAAGKTTLASAFVQALRADGIAAQLLDGDELRNGLNKDLGFSRADRAKSVWRTAQIACSLVNCGFVALVALVSPDREDRERVRQLIGADRFVEVFVDADLATCVARDPKGTYRLAQQGAISDFTGLSASYEAPEFPALRLATATQTVAESVAILIDHFGCTTAPRRGEASR